MFCLKVKLYLGIRKRGFLSLTLKVRGIFFKTYAIYIVNWSGGWMSPGSSALCESEATATNVFCSDSYNCLICAKAKRQQQMFSVAKAKRQLQQSAQPKRKSTTRYGDEPIF